MLIRIRSMSYSIKHYRNLLEKHLNFDHHYNVFNEQYNRDELQCVDVDINELFDMFEEFEDQYGGAGHITVDVKENIVWILDSWIE